MAFKLTYTDGQADDYDDSNKWEVEGGVLKIGREHGKWTVFVSPSHWATIELRPSQGEVKDKDKDEDDKDKDEEKDKKKDKADEKDKGEDKDKDEGEDKDKKGDKDS